MVCWKKSAAKHEHEELKERVWLEPIQAMFRRRTNESLTDKHRHVTRKLVVDGGLVQKTLYDIGWADEKKCRGCDKEEGTEKHRSCHCPCCKEVRNQIPDKLGKWEQRAKTSKKAWKWQRGIVSQMGIGKAQKLARSILCGSFRQARRARLVRGAIGARRGDGVDA